MSKASLFSSIKDFIALHYGDKPGRMLIHTGVIGWVLSAMAQVVAIAINDKIPKEQKLFLIPQEMADAAVNILSFYVVTQTFQSVAGKLVKTGKWLPAEIRTVLKNSSLADKVGKKGFDVLKDGHLSSDLIPKYKGFNEGIDVAATTVGSVLSCNIITPIIRNDIAARRQKKGLSRMNEKSNVENPVQKPAIKRMTLNDFQNLSYNKLYPSATSMKVL